MRATVKWSLGGFYTRSGPRLNKGSTRGEGLRKGFVYAIKRLCRCFNRKAKTGPRTKCASQKAGSVSEAPGELPVISYSRPLAKTEALRQNDVGLGPRV